MNGNLPLVYIVILNYNNFEDTIECLKSILKISYPNYKVIVIDNASENESIERIQAWITGQNKSFKEIDESNLCDYKDGDVTNFILIKKNKNTGYAGGNNIGIRFALENGAEYVWILNNDTVVAPSALTELVKVAERSSSIGLVGSKIYFLDSPERVWFSSGHYYYTTDKKDGITNSIEKEVKVISGCSFLIKRSLIDDIGLLWEGYFLYFEEDDYSMRAKRRGWKVYFSPESKVYHKISGSVWDGSPLFTYYKVRNYMIYTLRNDIEPLLLSFLFTIKEYLLPCLIRLKLSYIKYFLKAYKDFLKIYMDKSYK